MVESRRHVEMRYDPQAIDRKWQDRWAKDGLHRVNDDDPRPKWYEMTMYPYPSGDLHIGHWYANTSESGTAFGVADAYANTVLYLGKSLMHSIDPIRDQPIRVFIPNTWYDCGLDQEEPHSCCGARL